MQIFSRFLYVGTILLFFSCNGNSWKSQALEVNAQSKTIVEELQTIECKKDFTERQEKVRQLFIGLVDKIILADQLRRQQGCNSKIGSQLLAIPLLQEEIERVKSLEGCKEILELVQRDALHKLDSYDRKLQRIEPFTAYQHPPSRLRR